MKTWKLISFCLVILVLLLGYQFYPRAQVVIIEFTDGSQTTVGSLFQVTYKGKEVKNIKLLAKCDCQPTATSPIGTFDLEYTNDMTWEISPETLIDYNLSEGKHKIKITTSLGEESFELNLVDTRSLFITFG